MVGAGVTVNPPPGASVDVTQTRPGEFTGQALFYVGSVRYAIVARPFTGTLSQATTALRIKVTQTRGYQVTGPDSAIVTRDGVSGRQGTYSSSGRSGRYAVFVDYGVAVEVTIAGNDVDLRPLLPAIGASIQTIAFDPS